MKSITVCFHPLFASEGAELYKIVDLETTTCTTQEYIFHLSANPKKKRKKRQKISLRILIPPLKQASPKIVS